MVDGASPQGQAAPGSRMPEGFPAPIVTLPAKPADLHVKKRLVPLSKRRFKIVMRPRNELDLRMVKHYQLIDCLVEEVSDAVHLQVNHSQSILASHTEDETTVHALAQIHQLLLRGRRYPSYTYLAALDDSVKGVTH